MRYGFFMHLLEHFDQKIAFFGEFHLKISYNERKFEVSQPNMDVVILYQSRDPLKKFGKQNSWKKAINPNHPLPPPPPPRYIQSINQSVWPSNVKKFASIITRPNCALDRSTVLFLFVPGFQRQLLKYVPKCKWIPQTKFQWIPHTYTCNVNFVGTFVLFRIPQQATKASWSGFRNCKWTPQNVSEIRKCKWIPQTVSGFRKL